MNKKILRQKDQLSKLVSIVTMVFLLSAIFFYLCASVFRILQLDYSAAEYRDPAVLQVVNLLSEGINPYSSDYLMTNEAPRVLLDSSFLNVLPAVLLVSLFDLPVVFSTYIVNLFYVITAAVLFYFISLKLCGNRVYAITAVYLLLICFRRGTMLVVRPDQLAGLCLILIIFFVFIMEESKRNDTWIILVCAFICVAIFLLKTHYAVIAFSFACYLLIKNYKKAILFVLSGIGFSVLSILLLTVFYPTHLPVWFTRILQMSYYLANHVNTGELYNKFFKLINLFSPVLLILLFGGIWAIHQKVTKHIKILKINNKKLLFLIINSIANGLALLFVGQWGGADIWYFTFMLFPSLILLSLYFIKRIPILTKYKITTQIIFVFLSFVATFSVYQSEISSADRTLENKNLSKAYEILDNYASDDMYLSSHLSLYSVKHSKYNYNYGDAIYVPSINSALANIVFPVAPLVNEKHRRYADEILNNISEKKYSIITTDDYDPPLMFFKLDKDFFSILNANYQLIDEFPITNELLYQSMLTRFWIPKP